VKTRHPLRRNLEALAQIAELIPLQLGVPERAIRLWQHCVAAVRVLMPEATMDEDDRMQAAKDDVRFSPVDWQHESGTEARGNAGSGARNNSGFVSRPRMAGHDTAAGPADQRRRSSHETIGVRKERGKTSRLWWAWQLWLDWGKKNLNFVLAKRRATGSLE